MQARWRTSRFCSSFFGSSPRPSIRMRASSASCRHRCPMTLNNQTKQRNVFVALVNLNDALLVENNPMDIRDVKAAAKDFLIASGDGVMSHSVGRKTVGPNPDVSTIYDASGKNLLFPEREWVRKADVEARVAEYQQYVKAAGRQEARRIRENLGALAGQADHHRIAGWRLQAVACVSGHFVANGQEHVVRHLHAGAERIDFCCERIEERVGPREVWHDLRRAGRSLRQEQRRPRNARAHQRRSCGVPAAHFEADVERND